MLVNIYLGLTKCKSVFTFTHIMYLSISHHVNAKLICLCVFLLFWAVVMILVAASVFIVFQFLLHPSATSLNCLT